MDTVKNAFGPLIARADAKQGAADRISLRDYIVSVEIGAFQVERDITQRLKFNVVVEVPSRDPDLNDDVDKILSYDSLTDAIQTELAFERLNLLETLADRIAARILGHPFANRVFLRIEKLDRGDGDLGVEIVRDKPEQVDITTDQPRPNIVFFTEQMAESEFLGQWMNVLADTVNSVVICVDTAIAPFKSGSQKAQSHIDALAMDQKAWQVSAMRNECLVVGSRTELMWAISQGKMCVWAPYKMVFDAAQPVTGLSGFELAQWLGNELKARSISSIGSPDTVQNDIDFYNYKTPQPFL